MMKKSWNTDKYRYYLFSNADPTFLNGNPMQNKVCRLL